MKGSKTDGDISYMSEEQFKELMNSDFVAQAGCRQYVRYITNAAGHAIEINYADAVWQEYTGKRIAESSPFCMQTQGGIGLYRI